MKVEIDTAALADAVAWTSRVIDARPSNPILEALGGGHDDLVALELHANAGQYRAVFFAGD